MSTPILLVNGKLAATIQNGMLRSFTYGRTEFIHDPQEPGWGKSDDEMFPVIGPTAEVEYTVKTLIGPAKLDQHGLLRELEWAIADQKQDFLKLQKKYRAGERVGNSKFPGRSPQSELSWPYDFSVQKTFELKKDRLSVRFLIESEYGMPFQFGYHPAFKLNPDNGPITLECADEQISLESIMRAGSKAYPLKDSSEVLLEENGKAFLRLLSEGFGHYMCWTEVPNMICIEPITHYPVDVNLERFITHSLVIPESGKMRFSLSMIPQ